MQYRIAHNELITPTIRHVRLTPPQHAMTFQAGQFVEFVLCEKELAPFSIGNAPKASGELDFFIREDNADPRFQRLLSLLTKQSTLTIRGPFGECVYGKANTNTVILFAGGVGISQIKSIVEQAIAVNDQRAFSLYWGVAHEDDLFLEKTLQHWKNKLSQFEYKIAIQSRKSLLGLLLQDFSDFSNVGFYSCGPWKMTDDLVSAVLQRGMLRSNIYSDRFAFM